MGWVAGLYGGDYFDRRLDAISKPQRPIPSGRMGPGTALACMIGLIAAAAGLSVVLNWHVLILVGIATAVGLSYNGHFKAKGLVGNLVRGSMTAFAFTFGVLVADGRISVWLIAVAVVFLLQDTSSNLVGTLRDLTGDRAGGYLTYPVRRALCVAFLGGRHPTTPFLAAALVAMAMSWLVVVRLRQARAAMSRPFALRMHDVLSNERIVLAAAFAAWGLGTLPAVAVAIPALAVTWLGQRTLRARHEFPGAAVSSGQGGRYAALLARDQAGAPDEA
jgi:4-hydroxybenzoate polyprenyltransferase/geranylgeranylglycerol-phosphate geranylgeranyltransferase